VPDEVKAERVAKRDMERAAQVIIAAPGPDVVRSQPLLQSQYAA